MWLEKLVALKKASGKTLKQISLDSSVPIGTLNKLFAGQTKDPKLDTVCAVVHALGYTLNDIDSGAKRAPDTDEGAPGEKQMLSLYRELNTEGQEKLLDYADDLVSSGKYIKSSQDNLGRKKMA